MPKNKFKVSQLRTWKSPTLEDVVTYSMLVNFNDLPKDISLEVNPRKPKMTTSVAKTLINSVINTDVDFDIKNRGIIMTAKSVRYDSTSKEVTIDFDDDTKKFGILDGGHTYTAITENSDRMPNDVQKYVRVEVLVGDSLDASGLADARNTSAQVSDIALFELDNKFDMVKDALKHESYVQDIAFKDNDNKRIPVGELLRLMFAFNIDRFPDDSSAPVSAYSSKAAVFKDYSKNYSKKDNIYVSIAEHLPELVQLYEKIESDLQVKYQAFKKENGQNARFGGVRGVEKSDNAVTSFTARPIYYSISVGFIMPIFGAFRALLKQDNGQIKWQFDPLQVWDKVGVRLVQNTFETETNPQMAGKNKPLWQANYRIVDGERKDLLLEKLLGEQK